MAGLGHQKKEQGVLIALLVQMAVSQRFIGDRHRHRHRGIRHRHREIHRPRAPLRLLRPIGIQHGRNRRRSRDGPRSIRRSSRSTEANRSPTRTGCTGKRQRARNRRIRSMDSRTSLCWPPRTHRRCERLRRQVRPRLYRHGRMGEPGEIMRAYWRGRQSRFDTKTNRPALSSRPAEFTAPSRARQACYWQTCY